MARPVSPGSGDIHLMMAAFLAAVAAVVIWLLRSNHGSCALPPEHSSPAAGKSARYPISVMPLRPITHGERAQSDRSVQIDSERTAATAMSAPGWPAARRGCWPAGQAGWVQSGSVRGNPKMRSALLSGNPVTALIRLPARVSTSIPFGSDLRGFLRRESGSEGPVLARM